MSHVSVINVEITDLLALKAACKRLGFALIEGQTIYKWFGSYVGDYPLPQGFTKEELGKCDHAIRIPNANYEVGLVRKKDGSKGYNLLFDFWYAGGLEKAIGAGGEKLVQAYGVEKAKLEARRKGYSVYETSQQDGSIRLTIKKV